MKNVKFSIVTISYNQAQFLDQSIQSILNQDYPNLEYIIVDAESSDGSQDIINQYSGKISTVILEPDQGPADGLNKGFKVATGDWLAFINADDALSQGALNSVNRYLARHPDAEIIMGGGDIVDASGALIKPIRPHNFTLTKWLYGASEFIQQGMFFHRSAYEKTAGFNVGNHTCWDAELLADMLLTGAKPVCCDDVLGLFRIHEKSITGSGRLNSEYEKDKKRIFERVMGMATRRSDRLYRTYYRASKWLSNPTYYIKRYGYEKYYQLTH